MMISMAMKLDRNSEFPYQIVEKILSLVCPLEMQQEQVSCRASGGTNGSQFHVLCSMKSLKLDQDVLEFLISSSPLLERVTLCGLDVVRNIIVDTPNL